jgi:hypothetical protein
MPQGPASGPALLAAAVWTFLLVTSAAAEETFEDFADPEASARWGYVADGVMGGVSQGGAEMLPGDGGAVHLAGRVSTENDGGFIQVRRRLAEPLPDDLRALVVEARGNGERYYVFLRPRDAARVFHSYRASFVAGPRWEAHRLPLEAFGPSHEGMAPGIAPSRVAGIGLVAYGRDHDADLTVRRIALERGAQ